MRKIFVTGATGFIGQHLVSKLAKQGDEIFCLARTQSNKKSLEKYGVRFVHGDVNDAKTLHAAINDVDVVFHLAGLTKCYSRSEMVRVNQVGTRNVVEACASSRNSPVLILVSTMAAAGPSFRERGRIETDRSNPVSFYGKTKLAAESEARHLAQQVPTTILRPPIVFGEYDHDGFGIYKGIADLGIHLVPGLTQRMFSFIHADDLATSMLLAADRGTRITADPDDAAGTYFVADEETMTYANFGVIIGQILGRTTRVIRCPDPIVWMISAASEGISRIRRRPEILNLDKAREATSIGWACSSLAIQKEIGFRTARSIKSRLEQTVAWYLSEGWLKLKDAPVARA